MHDQAKWLGITEYLAAWELQKTISLELQEDNKFVILGCEHPTVITHGRRIERGNTLQNRIPEVFIERGGLSTIHCPGQVVIYPICNLKKNQFNVRDWVSFLLDVTKKALLKCNIMIVDSNNGLFTQNGKIASIGISISKGVSRHGIAINISNDLALFRLISPCGVQNQAMDRVDHYSPQVTTESFFALWCSLFRDRMKNQRVTLQELDGMPITH